VIASIAIVLAGQTTPAQSNELPLEDFARMPHMALVQISPDGRRLAFVSTVEGERFLIVRDLDSGEDRGVNINNILPLRILWGSNSRVLLSASDATRSSYSVRPVFETSAVLTFDLEENLAFRRLLAERDRAVGLNVNLGRILGVDRVNENVLIPAYDRRSSYDLISAGFDGDTVRTAASGTTETRDWVIDENGRAVARVDYSNRRNRQRLFTRPENEWIAVQAIEDATQIAFNIWGLLPDGHLAVSFYGQNEAGGRTRGLFAVGLETGEVVRPVFLDERYDMGNVIEDPYTNRTIGVTYESAFTNTVWFDEEIAQHQQRLETVFAGEQVTLRSWSEDRSRFVLGVENERNAPLLFLYDVPNSEVSRIGSPYGSLASITLPERRYVSYPARDGTTVSAYVTKPNEAGPFPTVVLPHGGPASRDVGGFDYLAHFLASRGYAVIQPNFRGSSGYGSAWETAGYGEWGTGVMQHDVTDALMAMIEAGVADPDRTCIMGWSYGGYSALAGATFTPELYQCAISIAGVADVPAMLRYSRERYGTSHWSYAYWSEAMSGDEDLDGMSALRDVSPRFNADQIIAPILLVHGELDTVVPESQSRDMHRALRRANVPVTYIELDGGGHSLVDNEAMRLQFMAEIERFLAEHIGE
jgi:dipeptidyl aminopeptidase/acylaminoacyl peptidase